VLELALDADLQQTKLEIRRVEPPGFPECVSGLQKVSEIERGLQPRTQGQEPLGLLLRPRTRLAHRLGPPLQAAQRRDPEIPRMPVVGFQRQQARLVLQDIVVSPQAQEERPTVT